MKEALIKVVIFGAGIGIGVLGTKEYFDKKYQKLADEEIESCKALFEKRLETNYAMPTKIKHEDIMEAPSTNEYLKAEEAPAKNYNDFYAPKKVEEAKTLSPKEDEPFDISVDEFEEDSEFMKVTLNLYMDDGALVYEETEELAIDSDTVGSENLDDFSRASFSSGYFRNPKENIDYEVIKVDGSYRELVAGDI